MSVSQKLSSIYTDFFFFMFFLGDQQLFAMQKRLLFFVLKALEINGMVVVVIEFFSWLRFVRNEGASD